MADNFERVDKPGALSDTLVVPFIFVPHGAPEPREWLAQHPGAVRIPARFVPRAASDRAGSDWQLQFDPFSAFTDPGETDEDQTAHWETARHDAKPAPSGMADYSADDPIVAYLRVNDALSRMGFGNHPGDRETRRNTGIAQVGSTQATSPASLMPPNEPDQSVLDEEQPRNPTAPVPLLDGHGKPVLHGNGKPILRPAGLDPRFFVQQGLKDRRVVEELLRDGSNGGGPAALGYELSTLRKFRQGGAWDAQRVGGIYHSEFVNYATIAIGLYAAAAGIPEHYILTIQDVYAMVNSKYADNAEFDKRYTNLPKANVKNTDIGYTIYQSYEANMPTLYKDRIP